MRSGFRSDILGGASLSSDVELGMKFAKQIGDFLLGVTVVAVFPVGILYLMIVGWSHVHDVLDGVAGMVHIGSMLVTLAAFIVAIWYRVRRHLSPRTFAIAEVVLGVVGAELLFQRLGIII